MPASYLPQPIADFNTFAINFSDLITADPSLYGLEAGDAAAIQTACDTFFAAYALSSVPATRTSVTVAATQAARNAATSIIRTYGRIILANAGVSDSDKTSLGLIIRDPVPTPIPAPATAPVVSVVAATPGILTATFRDSMAAPGIKAKPFGATGLELRALFGTTAPVSAIATPYYGIITRTPFAITCPAGSAGQSAFLYGRWLNAKGQPGPWSALTVSAII